MKIKLNDLICVSTLATVFGVLSCMTKEPVKLPEKSAQVMTTPAAPPSFQKWLQHFHGSFAAATTWSCRKTTEEEPKGHYCTIGDPSYVWTLYCNSQYCDVVTLVHEAKWSKSIPNPGFSAPIFSPQK